MDFKHLVGKEVVWTGTIVDKEAGCYDTYLLFSDNTGMVIPDKDTGHPTTMLDDAKQTLGTVVSENFEQAEAVIALAEILKHPMFMEWANRPAQPDYFEERHKIAIGGVAEPKDLDDLALTMAKTPASGEPSDTHT